MLSRRMSAVAVLAILFIGPAIAFGETAAEAFTRGETLLAKGDFSPALQSYADAARAERENSEYMQRYAMVRRIVDLRARLEKEQDAESWRYMAKALRAFYCSERVFPELLKIDQELHARLGSAETAAMLAETQLALNLNADAVKHLAAVEPDEATAVTQSLLGIALARTGKMDEAKRIAGKLNLPADADPGTTYAAARLSAGTGDAATALSLLKTCLEATLPSMQDGYKAHAKTCPEFAAIASSKDFAAVLETASKRSESKCSGGSSCAGCPMSGKCPKSQGQTP